MGADYEFFGIDFEMSATNERFTIRAQTVELQSGGPQRSGKYIHLSLSPAEGMRILTMLEACRRKYDLPIGPVPTGITVPPMKDRQ